ncbi:MAG TPA: tetratricopeptide repeat protein, partial [Candidatus Goldiibacteriota bacterium]|nr:tetratricopeptide repeat protein [Candidatus Goldiibacteriota bacterium]
TIAYVKFVEKKYPGITIYDTTNTIFKDIEKLVEVSRSTNIKTNVFTAFSKKISPVFSSVDLNIQQVRQAMHGLYIRLSDNEDVKDVIYPWYLYSLKNIIRDTDVFHEFEEREVVGYYLYRLAEFYKIMNKKDKYVYLLNKAASVGYDSVPVLTNVAIRFGSDDTIENGPLKAEELFNRAVILQPDNDMVLFNIGSFYGRYGFYDKALEYFDKTIKKNPANIMAKIYYNSLLKELEKQQNQQPLAAVTAGTGGISSGQTQNVIAAPPTAAINNEHFEAGQKLLEQKKIKAAISEFSKDIELNPMLDRSYFYIGYIYSVKDEIQKAIPFYENALTKNPNNTSTLNNLGLCYYRAYNRQKAKECFEKSLKINPNQDRIKKLYEELK